MIASDNASVFRRGLADGESEGSCSAMFRDLLMLPAQSAACLCDLVLRHQSCFGVLVYTGDENICLVLGSRSSHSMATKFVGCDPAIAESHHSAFAVCHWRTASAAPGTSSRGASDWRHASATQGSLWQCHPPMLVGVSFAPRLLAKRPGATPSASTWATPAWSGLGAIRRSPNRTVTHQHRTSVPL